MAERVDIWNSALGHIGQGTVIAGLDDPGPEARACRRFYPQARRAIFAAHPWRFANFTSSMSPITPTPPGSLYSYPAPAGLVEVRKLTYEDLPESPPIFYRLAGLLDEQGNYTKVLRTDQEARFLNWQGAVEAEAVYPELFSRALEWLLASDIASTFTRDERRRDECFKRYAYWLNEAAAADQRQAYEAVGDAAIIAGRQADAIDVLTVTGGAGIISGRV